VIVGLVVLVGAPTGTWLVLRRVMGLSRASARARYERKHAIQRARFGRDVAEAGSESGHG
jgi:hypothetical protein